MSFDKHYLLGAFLLGLAGFAVAGEGDDAQAPIAEPVKAEAPVGREEPGEARPDEEAVPPAYSGMSVMSSSALANDLELQLRIEKARLELERLRLDREALRKEQERKESLPQLPPLGEDLAGMGMPGALPMVAAPKVFQLREVYGMQGRGVVAVIEYGDQTLYKQAGDDLPDAWKLLKVDSREMTIGRGKARKTVSLSGANGTPPPAMTFPMPVTRGAPGVSPMGLR